MSFGATGPRFLRTNSVPSDGFATTILDESIEVEGFGLGQNASLLRDPDLQLVAPTRDDLAAKNLTARANPMYSRVPTATTTALVFQDAAKMRTNTDTVLRAETVRPVGPSELLVGDFEDFQFHPTMSSRASDARGGRRADTSLAGAWRYPYHEVGAVAAAGILTSQLNFQENKKLQGDVLSYASQQQKPPMAPGSLQQYGTAGNGLFDLNGGYVIGDAPVAHTQSVLTVVPASGAVVRSNDAFTATKDALTALDGIEDRGIQGERILAHDHRMQRLQAYRPPNQFA